MRRPLGPQEARSGWGGGGEGGGQTCQERAGLAGGAGAGAGGCGDDMTSADVCKCFARSPASPRPL